MVKLYIKHKDKKKYNNGLITTQPQSNQIEEDEKY